MAQTHEQVADSALSLESLRREIDRLDREILALIERRLAASRSIGALKAVEGKQFLRLRPGREHQVIERLIAAADSAPPQLISELWQTLMAHCLQAQGPLEVLIFAPRDTAAVVECSRARYGLAAPLTVVNDPSVATAAARERQAIAVLGSDVRWSGDATLHMFDRLIAADGRLLARVIGRVPESEALADPEGA